MSGMTSFAGGCLTRITSLFLAVSPFSQLQKESRKSNQITRELQLGCVGLFSPEGRRSELLELRSYGGGAYKFLLKLQIRMWTSLL